MEERFWGKVEKRGKNDCWLWTGSAHLKTGYGQFATTASKNRGAHRVAWELTYGCQLTPDEFVCHRCDTPLCCNPSHLFVGSHADNMRDMREKGRGPGRDKTHCKRGHAFDERNTHWYKNHRFCRKCAVLHVRNYLARKAAANSNGAQK